MQPVTLADVEEAARLLQGQIAATPFLRSRTLSEILGAEIWLKFENLQYTASFKERGAYVRLLRLSAEERRRGVVAMSAGNHAQGVAYHALRLGIPATIVMPQFTPFMKIENTSKLGARVVLRGETLDDAQEHVEELMAREGLAFIHPYDDPAIIAGQGTVGLEMLRTQPDLDTIVVPIGGGGLISGIATAAKALAPRIEIVGVEASLYPSVVRQLRGEPPAAGGPTIAEGIAVKRPGKLTLPIIRDLVSEVLLVEEAAIEAAVLQLLEIEKTVVEGAGAVTLAALATAPERFRGRRVGLVLSGGNIDSRLLSAVILRGLVRSQRLVRLRLGVPDSPGSLARITEVLAQAGANVVDVVHQRAFSRLSVKQTDIDFTVETRNAEHAAAIIERLRGSGFAVERLEDSGMSGL
ncbi:threonine ammonia-lyase [Geminicoccaceae bacterium 1502E]|nr:threonine ammonia-lyase [Geminicoccaceae bacterium 1502E]